MRMKFFATLCLCSAAFILMMNVSHVYSSQGASGPEIFSALAELPGTAATRNVTVYINGYSSDADAQRLHARLVDGGPNALLKALDSMKPLGRIEREGTVGFYDFKFIRSEQTDSGRKIFAITNRPIGWREAETDAVSTDYPFGVLRLELKTNKDGKVKAPLFTLLK